MKKPSNQPIKSNRRCITLNFDDAKPWANADIGFNLMNYEYPIYHDHNFWEIFIVVKGCINHLINDTSRQMFKGNACLIRPQDKHCIKLVDKNHDIKYLSFTMSDAYMTDFIKSYKSDFLNDIIAEKNPQYFNVNNMDLLNYMNTCLNFISYQKTLEQIVFQCKIVFIDIFNNYVKQLNKRASIFPEWFSDFILELNTHDNFFIPINELAKKTPYSYSRLSRIFKNLTGETLTSYITTIKMKRAAEYLLNSDMTILEISSTLNYLSVSHFLRTFKKYYNLSPKEYKKIKCQ